MTDDKPAAVIEALNAAHKLVNLGVPMVRVPGNPDRPGVFGDAEWEQSGGWKNSRPGPHNHDIVDSWKPGDALCAVMGFMFDAVDLDLYNGALESLRRPEMAELPRAWLSAATPSGGVHGLIKSLGQPKRQGLLRGVDYQGSDPDGSGRSLLYIAPTVKVSKVTGVPGPYRWLKLDWPGESTSSLSFGWTIDDSGKPFADLVKSSRLKRNNGTAGSGSNGSHGDYATAGRNNFLTSVGGFIRQTGWLDDEVALTNALLGINSLLPSPLDVGEVKTVAGSMMRYPAGERVTDEQAGWWITGHDRDGSSNGSNGSSNGSDDEQFARLKATRKVWHRADREAVRELDEERALELIPVRVKRTARDFAKVLQPEPIIDRVLAAEVNLLGGPTEAGKSLFARDWCLSLATMTPWRGCTVPERRNSLWIASEGMADFKERWESQSLWDRAADRVFILEEPISLVSKADVEWLLDEYREERPGLVVFDVIYGMGITEENGPKDVLPIISNLKRISATWKCATLAVGHSGHQTGRRFRGWSGWRQLAAVEWHAGGGLLSCEKSKIAQRSRLSQMYETDYPNIGYLTVMEGVSREAERRIIIQEAIRADPQAANTVLAERLAQQLGLTVGSARMLIGRVRRDMND